MSEYRLETILQEDSPSRFVVHQIGPEETQWIVSCESLVWAKKVKKALEWMDTLEAGRMSIPAPTRRKSPVRKPVAKKCLKRK
jgi:hypothetical protein